jgi:hypothetical protein
MDPRSWVDQLFSYGPYAVLALFALWVAPTQLKSFRQIPRGNRAQLLVGGFVAMACWAIVFAMVFYIYMFWPPRTVYLGSFGSQPAEAQFFSQTPQLYVSSKPAGGNRLRWDYAIVTDVYQQADNAFSFTYQWGSGAEDYRDFSLPLSLLKKQRIDLSADPDHPGELYYNDNNDPSAPRRPLGMLARGGAPAKPSNNAAFITRAHAQPRPAISQAVLIDWLASPNPNLRAQARAQLRQLSPEELKQLLQNSGLPAITRDQINDELRRRQ